MTDQTSNQSVSFSEAKQPAEFTDQEIEQQSVMDIAQGEPKLDYEPEAENKLIPEHNTTAHIPDGSTIAEMK